MVSVQKWQQQKNAAKPTAHTREKKKKIIIIMINQSLGMSWKSVGQGGEQRRTAKRRRGKRRRNIVPLDSVYQG